MNELIQSVGVLAGMAVVLIGLGFAVRAERRFLHARLQTFLGSERVPIEPETQSASPATPSDNRHPILRRSGLGAPSHLLEQAGISYSPLRFLFIQLVCGLAGYLLARLAIGRFNLDEAETLLYMGILATGTLIGLLLPRLILSVLRKRRLAHIERQLPTVIDSLANAIQAGLSLPQALDVIARNMPPPLGVELQIVVRDMALGLGIEEALGQLAFRVPLRDVEIFVAAVQIQYRTGGNLSDILRSIARTVRERLRIRGEIRVLTAQQRMAAVIVSALPFLIVLAIRTLSPSYFEKLLEPGTMRIMLIIAGFAMATGVYTLQRIANIEV